MGILVPAGPPNPKNRETNHAIRLLFAAPPYYQGGGVTPRGPLITYLYSSRFEREATWLRLSKPFWLIPFWLVGECTTHFRLYCVGIGMFTGGTIWILTHGHLAIAAHGVSHRATKSSSQQHRPQITLSNAGSRKIHQVGHIRTISKLQKNGSGRPEWWPFGRERPVAGKVVAPKLTERTRRVLEGF